MHILEFPSEILALLADHLYSLEDLYHLVQTCRQFRDTFQDSKAKLCPIFQNLHGQPLLQPHPHLLLAGTTRQLGDWAVSSYKNQAQLQDTLRLGNQGLLDLATKTSALSLKDIRDLHAFKYDVLTPLSKLIGDDVGPRSDKPYDTSDVWTQVDKPDIALLTYWIYCELFHHNVDSALLSMSSCASYRVLPTRTRDRWMAYCVPDMNNESRPDRKEVREAELLQQWHMWTSCRWFAKRTAALLHFQKTGCFLESSTRDAPNLEEGVLPLNNLMTIAPSMSFKESVFLQVCEHLGKDSLIMLLPEGLQPVKHRLGQIATAVSMLEEEDAQGLVPRRVDEEDSAWDCMERDINRACFEHRTTNMEF